MVDLRGHGAVISGALGDIGAAIARALAAAGADVALGDLHEASRAEPLLSELRARGVRACFHAVDVCDAAAVAAWVDAVSAAQGSPDIVIANAAALRRAGALELDAAAWREQLAVGLDGAFHLLQAAARRLRAERRPGRMLAIGSWAADHVHLQLPAYCVAKAGLRMLVRCLALELARDRILVNELAPGFVDAGLSAQLMAADPGLRASCIAAVPVGKLLTADDVARAALPLCDFVQEHCTGQQLILDGGLSLCNPASPAAPS